MTTGMNAKPPLFSVTSFIQLGFALLTTMSEIAVGMAFSFTAENIPHLRNMLGGAADKSWLMATASLVSPFGCLLAGYAADYYGRKPIIIVSQIPMCIGWLCIGLAQSYKLIVIGQIIVGIGCGMVMVVIRIYGSEITLSNIRAVVGALPNLGMAVGISLQAYLAKILKWNHMAYFCSAFCLFLFGIFFWLTETPHYLLMASTEEATLKSLQTFRNMKKYNVHLEMVELKHFKTLNMIRRLSLKEKFVAVCQCKAVCKPFGIVLIYLIVFQLAGVTVMFEWIIDILKESKSSLDPKFGTISLSLTRVITGVIAAIMYYKIGRKPMTLLSDNSWYINAAIGVGIVCLIIPTYLIYTKDNTVVPQIFYTAYIMFATLGYYNIPLLLMSEVFPLQIRGLMCGLTLYLANVFVFISYLSFPFLREVIGLINLIYVYGVCSLLGGVLLYYIIPETRDVSLTEIEEYYQGLRPSLVPEQLIRSSQLLAVLTKPKPVGNKSSKVKKVGPAKNTKWSTVDFGSTSQENDASASSNEQSTKKHKPNKP